MNKAITQNLTANLDIFDYFHGRVKAWGFFEDRFGNLRRSFTVDIVGSIVSGKLILDEHFHFDDGERQTRIWTIQKNGYNHYLGTADDVIGLAKGTLHCEQVRWRYRMYLNINRRKVKVQFDDLMVLQPDGVLLNRARVSKFGLCIGTVFICFQNGFFIPEEN
jgi:hypothetical protein